MSLLEDLLYHDYKRDDLSNWDKSKRRWAHQLKSMPKSSDILSAYLSLIKQKKITPNSLIEKTLKVRKVRTLSGVAPFAVMMKPYPCPGNCIYCPLEKGMPKSYMSDEPAAARAKQLEFDPKKQVLIRIEQMEKTGHHPEKLQIIVIGGTFSAYPLEYRKWFLKTIFDTCNGFESENIEEAQVLNEKAKYRIIGMSIETRPDWITEEEIKFYRQYGITKVQLGVQALDEEIYKKIRRNHTIEDVCKATKLLRNAGFKINYHFMPNLPGSTPDKDVLMAAKMFSDPKFKPDTLKIYPCIVIPGTDLYLEWQKGNYLSYDDETLTDVLVKIKQIIPPYCRIDRLVRDITKKWNASGTQKTNMRQIVTEKMKSLGITCQCIRCREVQDKTNVPENCSLNYIEYEASEGKELFLQFEDKKHLYGMLRLRFSSKRYEPLFPILKETAIIRELQVFGQQLPFGENEISASQHKSIGKKLVAYAEELSKQAGYTSIAIISGVGVRDYYRKLGYKLIDTYMVKKL